MRDHLRPSCLLLCLGVAGCGGPSNAPATAEVMEQTALSDVAELYRTFTTSKNRPPQSIADFEPMAQMSPTGLKALRGGEIVVYYGATMPEPAGEGPASTPSEQILAYQKRVPEGGGLVLLLDRRVRKMTADEFKAAPKAGK